MRKSSKGGGGSQRRWNVRESIKGGKSEEGEQMRSRGEGADSYLQLQKSPFFPHPM